MGCFQQQLLLFTAMAFAIAIAPALKAGGCEHDLYASVVKRNINMGFRCCEAIQGLDYKCKNWMFNHGRFTPEFGNRVKRFCATLGVTLPPSYRIYYPQTSGQGGLGD
ncbi:hypothetical protein F3Y22_tig00116971pilonHSYRG00306 [Hibiscus syriacus]|uniref:Prolamin-like domain-containing protein n=1 Tax=Hibiscus syriacus TaxID=106335 RepID=A0A6A2XW31_HIBSY|nr:hypothetical protein F3Y22_tig00116971pilonHSYRG00306 [Hibiscus syriacus]